MDKWLLFPYYLILKIRHFLYDKGFLKSREYPVNTVCIGNITVGGTGKTPHTELLIRKLKDSGRVAVLSRGYRRESKGFRIVRESDSFRTAGDEPLQIKQKFPEVTVAVCGSRREGIERLLELPEAERPGTILLDDAFQHRSVKPRHSVVLMKYGRPIDKDRLLPLGTLRDLPEQIRRAECVVITKSPLFGEIGEGIVDPEAASEEVRKEEPAWRNRLGLRTGQGLYFSIVRYGAPRPVFPSEGDSRYVYAETALFFTGIANDSEFRSRLVRQYKVLDGLKFPDHRKFSARDQRKISRWASRSPVSVLFTTEKDSKRLSEATDLSPEVRRRMFYLPIEAEIIPPEKEEEFVGRLGR